MRERKERDAGENSETGRIVKNREHKFGGMDSGVFTGYLSRQILKAEVQRRVQNEPMVCVCGL